MDSALREDLMEAVDDVWAETLRHLPLSDGQEDLMRQKVEFTAVVRTGDRETEKMNFGRGSNARSGIAAAGGHLRINRSVYPEIKIHKGDKFVALDRVGEPAFEVLLVDDRSHLRLICELGGCLMSLTMMALRVAAVEALKAGETLVGANVLDSQISAIDQTVDGDLRTDQQRPFIAVYSDVGKAGDLGNLGLRANGRVELTFNCGVSLTMGQTNKETGETEIIEGFPSTDAQFEAILDVLGCQICRTLTDRENPWAQVFGSLCTLMSKSQVRSSSAAENVRLACGQIKLTVDAYADPPYGQVFAEGSHWLTFLALMEERGVKQLGLFQLMLGQPNASDASNLEVLTGMTTRDAASLRLYSFEGASDESKIESSPASVVDRS